MSYATPADVIALFRNLDVTKTDTAVTSVQIQKWLNSTSLEINAKLSQIYNMNPAWDENTYPEAWEILGQIEAYYVADIVDRVLYKYEQGESRPNWGKKADTMLGYYWNDECDKCAPPAVLPGVPYIGVASQLGGFKASRTSTAPVFKKGENNW